MKTWNTPGTVPPRNQGIFNRIVYRMRGAPQTPVYLGTPTIQVTPPVAVPAQRVVIEQPQYFVEQTPVVQATRTQFDPNAVFIDDLGREFVFAESMNTHDVAFNDLSDLGRPVSLEPADMQGNKQLSNVVFPFIYAVGCTVTDVTPDPASAAVSTLGVMQWASRARNMANTSASADGEKVAATALQLQAHSSSPGEGLAPIIIITLTRGDNTRPSNLSMILNFTNENKQQVARQFKAQWAAGTPGNVATIFVVPHAMVNGEPLPNYAFLRTNVLAAIIPALSLSPSVPSSTTFLNSPNIFIQLDVPANGAAAGMGLSLEAASVKDQRVDPFWHHMDRIFGRPFLGALDDHEARGLRR